MFNRFAHRQPRYLACHLPLLWLLVSACGDESNDPRKSSDSKPPSTEASDAHTQPNAPESDAGQASEPLYAMMVQVYDPEDRTVYVSLSDTLDLESTELDNAREFASVANFAAIAGRLLVSDGLEPSITSFEIGPKHQWLAGDTVNFGGFPLSDNANFYHQFILSDDTVVLPFDTTKRIVWDPSTMTITKTLEDSTLQSAYPKLTLEAGGNRNAVRYSGRLLQAFHYHDDDWYDFGSLSHIVAYDPDTLEESTIIDVPCPGLSLATRDEAGNTYFSTWDLPLTGILGKEATPCVAKLGPDASEAETLDFRTQTGGRFVNNFRYVGGGKAIASVLHHEELGVDDPADLQEEDLGKLWESGKFWQLWVFDLNQDSAKPISGIGVEIGSGSQFARLDGRTFVFLPYDDWQRSKGYELTEAGEAIERFDTLGDVFKWVRVR